MSSQLKTCLLLVVISAFAGACSTTGTRALKDETSSSITEKLKEGVTTKAEVYAMLGDPVSISFTENGLEILTYEYARFTPKARNFIPYNFFWLGSDGRKKVLVVLLDEGGLIKKAVLNESDVETKAGVFE